jgi:deoxyribodipyrimidine photo-lyase
LPTHLLHFPEADPLAKVMLSLIASLPRKVTTNWPIVSKSLLAGELGFLKALPIDHSVPPAPPHGGHTSARTCLLEIPGQKLPLYAEQRNQPELEVGSGFSPFLHFGHLSVHEVFIELVRREEWKPEKLSLRTSGSREGWWNMSPAAEDFLDEIIT